MSISLSDGQGMSVAWVGSLPVGVDIEVIEPRDCETWRGLLGDDGYALALKVERETREPFDSAATRVWTLLEAGKKALSLRRVVPHFTGLLDGAWLSFRMQEADHTLEFVSVLFSQSKRVICMSAAASNLVKAVPVGRDERQHLFEMLRDKNRFSFDFDYSGPQNQVVFSRRIPVAYRAIQTPSKKVHFTSYAKWFGDIREHVMSGVTQQVKSMVSDGGLGLATIYYRLEVLDEVGPEDIIESRLWMEMSMVFTTRSES